MASEKSETPSKGDQVKKKGKSKGGKSLKQAGNWFHRNKALITWALVIAFASTCIGLMGIMYIVQVEKQKQEKKGQVGQEIDKSDENIKYWQDIVTRNPEDPQNEGNLGWAYQEKAYGIEAKSMGKELKGDDKAQYDDSLKQAEEHYKKALERDKGYLFAASNLADIYLIKNDSASALKVLTEIQSYADKQVSGATPDTKALSSQEKLSIIEKLCHAYFLAGKYNETLTEGAKVLKDDPGNYSVRAFMARAYYAEKKYDQALITSQEARDIITSRVNRTSDEGARRGLVVYLLDISMLDADIFMTQKDYQKAKNSFDQAKMWAMVSGNQKASKEIADKMAKAAPFLPKETVTPEALQSPGALPRLSPGVTQPSPGASQPSPGASQPSPEVSQPSPGAVQPSPEASQPSPGAVSTPVSLPPGLPGQSSGREGTVPPVPAVTSTP